MAPRSARREARSRAEADAGHRKRALLPLPEQRAYELTVFVQWSARREARSRAEADAGHRKRALLPLPEQRAYELTVFVQRSARREARSRAEADAGHRKRTYREGVTYHERPYQVSGRYPRVLCLL